MNSDYAIVLLSDSAYLNYTKQVFYTAARYGNWSCDFVLLAYEVNDDKALAWFRERGIKIVELNRTLLGVTHIAPERRVYFGKLYLFHPFFKQYKKIIYLDTDIIVRKDFKKLLSNNTFTAADDYLQFPLVYQFTEAGKPYGTSEINQYFSKQALKKVSFNTGVMLIPTSKNSQQAYDELTSLANKYGHFSTFFEQGIINLFFLNRKRQKMPYAFNDYYRFESFNYTGIIKRLSDKDSVIIHCLSCWMKPWYKKGPYYKEWEANMAMAEKPWDFKPEGLAPSSFSIWKVNAFYVFKIKTMPLWQRYNLFEWHVALYLQKRTPALYSFLKKLLKK